MTCEKEEKGRRHEKECKKGSRRTEQLIYDQVSHLALKLFTNNGRTSILNFMCMHARSRCRGMCNVAAQQANEVIVRTPEHFPLADSSVSGGHML